MAQLIRFLSSRRFVQIVIWILAFVALGALYYWLLPVSIQSRLSADHVRRAFGSNDLAPVAARSLSSLWTLLLEIMNATGLVAPTQVFATAAALSGWVTLASFVVLALYVPWPVVVLLALTPAILWTAVVPNGLSLSFPALALVGYFSRPNRTFAMRPSTALLSKVIEGVACVLTPAAWVLILVNAVRLRNAAMPYSRAMRALLFVVGLSLPFSIGIVIDAVQGQAVGSFEALPVAAFFRDLPIDDALAAAAAMVGRGGELTLGLLASLAIVVGILLSPAWKGANRFANAAKWMFLVLPFLAWPTAGRIDAWRITHPGWNTIVEDFAQSVDRGFSQTVIAFTRTATEEAALRYVDQLLTKKPKVVALRPLNLFEPSTDARIIAREPRFDFNEARTAAQTAAQITTSAAEQGIGSGFDTFVDHLLIPNLKHGVQFWLDTLPDRREGLEIQFLGNGIGVRGIEGPTKFGFERDRLRATFIRARMSAHEFAAGPSVEARIFERYATFHLAMARVIETEKRTIDWEARARGEYYAALKKVEWLKEPYQKVCVAPQTKAGEPLDICQEVAWFHAAPRN